MRYADSPEIFPPAVLEIVRLRKHLRQSSDIITESQIILTDYLADPSYSPTVVIAKLLELLDNREIVARQAEWAAALARVADLR